jgi:two-component system OmpR family response regulator
VRGLDTGADDYVVKPFDLPELLARLRALIPGPQANRECNTDRRCSIDTGSRTVTQRGEPVTLTAREYGLVEYLALHRGKLVATALYEHLFDEMTARFRTCSTCRHQYSQAGTISL